MEIINTFLSVGAWIALLTLTFMEVVLGIDNILFLSIMTNKVTAKQQGLARVTGLVLAMLARILLLFGISVLMQLNTPLISLQTSWISGSITGQSLIVLAGGLFLLYKSVIEIHQKIEGNSQMDKSRRKSKFWPVIIQIVALDVVFSFDSVLTAVGMVSFKDFGYAGAMTIMVIAIVLSVCVMLIFATPVSQFVNTYPAIQLLALSFLILIAVMLLVEAAHLAGMVIFGTIIYEIPKEFKPKIC